MVDRRWEFWSVTTYKCIYNLKVKVFVNSLNHKSTMKLITELHIKHISELYMILK